MLAIFIRKVKRLRYTVKRLSELAGISPRTLRYYDEIGLLKPANINHSGYRIYGQKEVDKLQQILFYKEMGLGLEEIKNILNDSNFDELKALREHKEKLVEKRNQLDTLISNVDKTIAAKEGLISMSDKEKFEGFKKQLLEENEKKYGKEIREKYGEDVINRSYKKFKNMTKEEYDEVTKLGNEILETLKAAMEEGNPAGALAQKAADLHRQWLTFYWDFYTKEAHAGLAQMYVDDPRFREYYDKVKPGAAEFLRDAIFIYTGKKDRL